MPGSAAILGADSMGMILVRNTWCECLGLSLHTEGILKVSWLGVVNGKWGSTFLKFPFR